MEAVYVAPREILSEEVIYITLQEVFWLVSIAFIVFQVLDTLHNKKK